MFFEILTLIHYVILPWYLPAFELASFKQGGRCLCTLKMCSGDTDSLNVPLRNLV